MTESRFTAIEGRLTDVERAMNHYITKFNGLETKVDTAIKNTDDILGIVDKGRKVFGVAIKNWRTIMIFGAGCRDKESLTGFPIV